MSPKEIMYVEDESNSWKRLLEFLQIENDYLLNRLSEELKEDADEDFLERAEYFQGRFIEENDAIELFRKDIGELDSLLKREEYMNGKKNVVMNKYKHLKTEIDKLASDFSRLKDSFTFFLTGV